MQNSPLVDDLKGDKTTAGSVSSCEYSSDLKLGFDHFVKSPSKEWLFPRLALTLSSLIILYVKSAVAESQLEDMRW